MLRYSIGLILLLFVQFNYAQNSIDEIILNEHWTFKSLKDSIWLPATVPGTVHTDLIENGIIEDPYYRLNEQKVQWVDKKDWIYQKSFISTSKLLQDRIMSLLLKVSTPTP
jgi:beta-mannosidase